MSSDLAARIAAQVDPERLKQTTLDLVRIRSYSGDEVDAAAAYADMLRACGLDVEIGQDEDFPQSPNVIGRLRGTRKGPCLQIDGHTDTIAVPGPEPRFEAGCIWGRGAEDMKGGLAAMAEAARVLHEAGVSLGGDLLLTAHGRHELGTNETLERMIANRVLGDAVIVAEGGGDALPVAGLGLCIWELTLRREGEAVHETLAPEGMPHPLLAGLRAADLLRERARTLEDTNLDLLGPESLFIGKFQSGDYFNRVPTKCVIGGSRRFGPESSLADMRAEFETLAETVSTETGATVDVSIRGLESYAVARDARIVQVIRQAHRAVKKTDLPFSGIRTAANGSNFAKSGGVPCVYYGMAVRTAHADDERVELNELVRLTHVYVHAILAFLGTSD